MVSLKYEKTLSSESPKLGNFTLIVELNLSSLFNL